MASYYTALTFFTIMLMLNLSALTARNDALSKNMKFGIILSSLMIVAASACEFLGVRMDAASVSLRIPHMLVKFIELSLAPVIPIVFANAIHPIRSIRLIIALLVQHCLLQFASMHWGITFYVDENNIYQHCSFYWIYHVAYFLSIAFFIVHLSRSIRFYQIRNRLSLILIFCFLLSGIVWSALVSELRIVWLAIAIGEVLLYVFYSDILQQTDPLTQLLNRRSFEAHIGRLKQRCVILYADIDRFKDINDTYGHAFGDQVLTVIGDTLKFSYGKYGRCYRIGGDEFCILLDTNVSQPELYTKAFYALLEEKRRSVQHLPNVSVGYAVFVPGSTTASEAVEKADQMMYALKQRNRLNRLRAEAK